MLKHTDPAPKKRGSTPTPDSWYMTEGRKLLHSFITMMDQGRKLGELKVDDAIHQIHYYRRERKRDNVSNSKYATRKAAAE